MAEHPILFSSPMVRALLNTRVGTFPPVAIDPKHPCKGMTRRIPDAKNAKWKVGDRLWVKETWIPVRWGSYDAVPRDEKLLSWDRPCIQYAADEVHGYHKVWDSYEGLWRPSIFMFRWASRILLEITARNNEPLQSITEQEAIAEGVEKRGEFPNITPWRNYQAPAGCPGVMHFSTAARSFCSLWDLLNASRGYTWDTNPTVSAFSFKRVEVAR